MGGRDGTFTFDIHWYWYGIVMGEVTIWGICRCLHNLLVHPSIGSQ